ncbi:MAG: hypothetical protein M1826_001747 [Phylliscum demangeonii]|nr:MAG: hypothetical protein M1826_001747 [Phylliscum demangeonii]
MRLRPSFQTLFMLSMSYSFSLVMVRGAPVPGDQSTDQVYGPHAVDQLSSRSLIPAENWEFWPKAGQKWALADAVKCRARCRATLTPLIRTFTVSHMASLLERCNTRCSNDVFFHVPPAIAAAAEEGHATAAVRPLNVEAGEILPLPRQPPSPAQFHQVDPSSWESRLRSTFSHVRMPSFMHHHRPAGAAKAVAGLHVNLAKWVERAKASELPSALRAAWR